VRDRFAIVEPVSDTRQFDDAEIRQPLRDDVPSRAIQGTIRPLETLHYTAAMTLSASRARHWRVSIHVRMLGVLIGAGRCPPYSFDLRDRGRCAACRTFHCCDDDRPLAASALSAFWNET
jgi:hypothetical protein